MSEEQEQLLIAQYEQEQELITQAQLLRD